MKFFKIFLLVMLTAIIPLTVSGAEIELRDGAVFDGELISIQNNFHFFKVNHSDVKRVEYTKPNKITLRAGIIVRGNIEGFQNDIYTIKISSSEVKSITNSPKGDDAVKDAFPLENVLRLHGSNTIGAKLAPALAKEFLKDIGAVNIQESTEINEESMIQGIIDSNPFVIEIHAHGSSTAFEDLESGKCDIGMASRKIKDKEVSKLAHLGDMTSDECEHVLGLDGIAVIVNKSNPIFKLEKDDISRIFSGEYSDWAQLGGVSGRINVYARDDKSGTWDTFKHIVLGSKRLVSTAKRYEGSEKLSDDVSNDKNGIGFIGLPYVKNCKALAVSEGANPFPPDEFTVAVEDYPLSRRLYLYTASNPVNPYIRKFKEFALSVKGQEIVKNIGFVGQNISQKKHVVPGNFTSEYLEITNRCERLSTTFRFRSGSDRLDTRAMRDIVRIADFLKKYRGREILLLGFTDDIGDAHMNKTLSEERAKTVQDLLETNGISVRYENVIGFGETNPVASNNNEQGKERNRRVEIWLKP